MSGPFSHVDSGATVVDGRLYTIKTLLAYINGNSRLCGFGRRGTLNRPWYPGNADIAADERLARHTEAGGKLLLRQVLALLGFDGIGILQPLFDSALARPAQPAAAFEWNATLLAQRNAQQIAVRRSGDGLAAIGQKSDFDHGAQGVNA